MTTGDQTLVWDTDHATVRTFPQSGAQAVRPDGRVYVAADDVDGLSVYDLASEGDNPTALTVFSANDQSVPLLAFSHDGSLLAEGRRSWVALWDMRDPSSPQRLGAWHSNVGDPTAVAVLDDGRVLVASATTRLAVWNALGDGSSATLVAGRTDTGVQHLSVAADGSTVLVDYPSFDGVALVDIGDRYDDRHLQRRRPERPALDAAAGELDLEPVLRRRHGGQLRPRRPRLRVRHRRRAPDHRADRRATPRWSPTPSSTTRGCCSPPASTARCGCGTRAHRRPRSRATSPTTCAASSAVGSTPTAGSSPSRTTTVDVPCPATEAPEPAAAEGVELRRRRLGTGGEHPEHGGLPGHLRGRDVVPHRGAAALDRHDHHGDQGRPLPDGGQRRRSRLHRVAVDPPPAAPAPPGRSAPPRAAAAASAASTSPTAPPRSPSPWTATRPAGPWPGSARSATPTTSRSRSPSAPQASCPWSTTAACWRCSSAADGVATVVDPALRPPTGVGVATHGDAASCDFDDITLTTTP